MCICVLHAWHEALLLRRARALTGGGWRFCSDSAADAAPVPSQLMQRVLLARLACLHAAARPGPALLQVGLEEGWLGWGAPAGGWGVAEEPKGECTYGVRWEGLGLYSPLWVARCARAERGQCTRLPWPLRLCWSPAGDGAGPDAGAPPPLPEMWALN